MVVLCVFSEADAYDVDYDEKQDGRYLSRPYGPYLPTKNPLLAYSTANNKNFSLTTLMITLTILQYFSL